MTEDEHLERHLAMCQRLYERMLHEGTWPWPDSRKSDDVVDSKDPNTDL